jgi:N-acetyl-anhydromuramyl-L-alanine amidase AmpD
VPSTIKPNRTEVSRSFPVLGFTINTGVPNSWFEVALATDPTLFVSEAKPLRTSSNFFSTRGSGLLRAERGESIYLVDPTVLARLSSSERLYYALATYRQADGRDPEVVRLAPEVAPPIYVSKSFAGASRRLFSTGRPVGGDGYGTNDNGKSLEWGGDMAAPGNVERLITAPVTSPATNGNGTSASNGTSPAGNGVAPAGSRPVAATNAPASPGAAAAQALDFYDDGYPSDFWVGHPQSLAEDDLAGAEVAGQAAGQDGDGGGGIEGPIPDDGSAPVAAQGQAARGLAAQSPEYPAASRFEPAHPGNYRARTTPRTIERIVIHITDGGSRIGGPISWFKNPAAKVSAHYIVGQDGEVVQMVRHNDVAWHASSANGNAIGIEHVANTKGLVPTVEQYAASAALVQWLCGEFGISTDRDHVLGHSEADLKTTHTGCPNAVWDWPYYMALFQTTPEAPAPSEEPDATSQGWYGGSGSGVATLARPRPAAVVMGQLIDVQCKDVEPVPQMTGMSCWAAAAAMVVGWRDRVSINPEEIARGAGHWSEYSTGLYPNDHDDLARAWGLAMEPGMSYSVQGFANLLQDNGPLWIGVALPSGHAVVAIGVSGDGTPEGSVVHYHDPWPVGTGAANQSKPYSQFMAEYETRMTVDDAGNVNVQIMHGNGRRPLPVAQAAAGMSFDVNWPDLQLVNQPTDMSCWAAAAAMVVGWRDRISIDPTEIAHGSGHWEQYTSGLFASEFPALRDGFKLDAEPLQSFTIDAIRALLESKGPLWVAADVPGFHAIAVTGIYGDGSQDGSDTFVRIADPWDRDPGTPGAPGAYLNTHDHGSRYVLTWRQFVEEYENTQRHGNAWGDVRIQILHASDTSGRQPSMGSSAAAQGLALASRLQPRAPHHPGNGKAAARSLGLVAMDLAGVERMRAEFVANAGAGAAKRNCITITNAGLRQLYGPRLQNPDGTGKALGSTVQDTMAALMGYGLTQLPEVFEFQDASGKRTLGVSRPDSLISSVEAWLNAQGEANAQSAWYVFGLSIMDGYHSVVLALMFSGTGNPLTRVYWADQIYSGWDDVTGGLDARITQKTQGWWDPLASNRKARTRVTVWPLNP